MLLARSPTAKKSRRGGRPARDLGGRQFGPRLLGNLRDALERIERGGA
jgi:hypothetical protein